MTTLKRNWILLLALTVAAAGSLFGQAVETTQSVERADSLLILLSKGGIVMIPLLLCSFLAVTLSIERFFSLGKKTVMPEALENELKEVLDGNTKNKVAKAKEVIEAHPSPLADIYTAGMAHWDHGTEEADKAMGDAASLSIRKMRRSIRPFRLIAGISPLMGLLGTVVGMIRAFQTVALSSQSINKAELLAEGIYQAMVTTASGLTIAIPTLIVFFYFNNRIDKIAETYEQKGNNFVYDYFRSRLKLES
jgi:biopolymer transport protein ExbB